MQSVQGVTELLLADHAKSVVAALQRELPQALVLYGEQGVGLLTIARCIAGEDSYLIQPEVSKTSTQLGISIDVIRQLYVNTRSIHSRRVVIIDDAEKMSLSAQHAFLKLLEEPPSGTHFLLLSHNPQGLLPTIRSRLQQFQIPRVPGRVFMPWLSGFIDDSTKLRQLQFVASGRPALAKRIADDDRLLESVAETMRDAQIFVGSDRYQAYRVSLHYSASRGSAMELIDASLQILHHTAMQTGSLDIITSMETLVDVYDQLKSNAQPRLQLLRYVVQ